MDEAKARMAALYGENRRIEDRRYDESLVVMCVNGIFVGQSSDGVIAYHGIPYATPPVGDLRWKAPVEAAADDGVYEARYFGKVSRQEDNASQLGAL